jgi:hypothetical protein
MSHFVTHLFLECVDRMNRTMLTIEYMDNEQLDNGDQHNS